VKLTTHRFGVTIATAVALSATSGACAVTVAGAATRGSTTLGVSQAPSAQTGGRRPYRHRPPQGSLVLTAEPDSVSGRLVCADADLVPAAGNARRIGVATVCIVNRLRAAAGETRLTWNPALTTSAKGHSADMVGADYIGQTSPSGTGLMDRLEATGYAHTGGTISAAENIAASSAPLTPAATVGQWLSSAETRANMLNPDYRQTGVGVVNASPAAVGSSAGATYTEDFGVTS
jgi:uncharacterized protein YkwD